MERVAITTDADVVRVRQTVRGIAEQIVHGDWVTIDLSELGMQRVLEGRPFAEAAIV